MLALHTRERDGRGQVVDLSLIEPILALLGPQLTWYDQLGIVPQRRGNRSENTAPRNTYLARDGRWVALAASALQVAERLMHLVGRPDFISEPWFGSGVGRAEHADQLDPVVAAWVAARDAQDAVDACAEAGAAATVVYDVRDVMSDPQYAALETIIDVPDPDLGRLAMQNVMFRMSQHPGEVRWAGRRHGQDTDEILTELGLDAEAISVLRGDGVVG